MRDNIRCGSIILMYTGSGLLFINLHSAAGLDGIKK